ncbi:LysE family translocator [Stenotrophomonas sp.]|uniref:LysE family translocator n=1 Tax=Stenotrophomonas sp. TaxID=69392 RepID=UPI002FC7AB02
MNLMALYVASVVVMIALPGPVTVFVAGTALAGGTRQALRVIVGTNAASLVLIVLSTLVVRGLLSVNETAFSVIKAAGALYIGYLGLQLLRDARHPAAMAVPTPPAGGIGKGFAMAIANPKDILFFASFFPQFLAITPHPDTSLVVLTLAWIVLDFSVLLAVCVLVRRLLRPRVHRVLLGLSGAFLVVVAVIGVAMAGQALLGR